MYNDSNKTVISNSYEVKSRNINILEHNEEEEGNEDEVDDDDNKNEEIRVYNKQGNNIYNNSISLNNNNTRYNSRLKCETETQPSFSYSTYNSSLSKKQILDKPSSSNMESLPKLKRLPIYSHRSNIEPSVSNASLQNVIEEEGQTEDETVDEITLPIVENEDINNESGNTPSESEGSVSSYALRPNFEGRDVRNDKHNDKFDMPYCSFRDQNKTLSRSSTGINFSSHLQTEKSLFSDKNLSSLNNSTMSLNSWTRRPSFNANLYGSTSALSDSRLMNIKSPFYNGRTMYGGSSTYRKNLDQFQKSAKVPVQIRPSSSLSKSSNNSGSENNPALSNTAKRILELMNQFTSPLLDAKKMANSNVSKILPLSKRQRFSEDELQLNRSIKLNYAKTPYQRVENKKEINKSLTTELQIPTVTQLLQMKNINKDNEQVRQLADGSKNILNTRVEYQLPAMIDETDAEKQNVKQLNKIKTKISSIRQDKQSKINDIKPPELKLPNISLPEMKNIPKIDIEINKPVENVTKPIKNFEFKSLNPIKDTNVSFKFSEPIKIGSENIATSIPSNLNAFKFRDPIFINEMEKKMNSSSKILNLNSSDNLSSKPVNKVPELKSGNVLDALKKFAESKKENSEPLNKIMPITNSFGDKFKPNSNTWECTMCMIRNDNKLIKCLACETPKEPEKKESTPQLTQTINSNQNDEKFKQIVTQQKSKWECSDCMTYNDQSADKCACCSKVKEGVNPNTTDNKAITKDISVNQSDTFKQLVAKQNEKWECSTCLTRNDAVRIKCVCCEQVKPGSESVPNFSFGSKPTGNFTFGVQNNLKESKSETVKSNFTFGIPQSNANVVNTKTTPSTVGFTFGAQPQTSTTLTSTSGGFSFGSQKPSTETKAPPTFTFGNFANKDSSTPSNTVNADPIKTNNAQDGSVKDSKISTSDSDTKVSTASTGGFVFGSKSAIIKPTEIISNSTISDTKNLPKSLFGGVPLKNLSEVGTTKTNESNLFKITENPIQTIVGETSSLETKSHTINFGLPKTTVEGSSLTNTTNSSSFSFGTSSTFVPQTTSVTDLNVAKENLLNTSSSTSVKFSTDNIQESNKFKTTDSSIVKLDGKSDQDKQVTQPINIFETAKTDKSAFSFSTPTSNTITATNVTSTSLFKFDATNTPPAATTSTLTFGNFNSPSTQAFSQTQATTPIFGNVTHTAEKRPLPAFEAGTSSFGQSSNKPFGTPVFGSSAVSTTQTSTFATPSTAFGSTPPVPAFGSTSTPIFGTPFGGKPQNSSEPEQKKALFTFGGNTNTEVRFII